MGGSVENQESPSSFASDIPLALHAKLRLGRWGSGPEEMGGGLLLFPPQKGTGNNLRIQFVDVRLFIVCGFLFETHLDGQRG